jgi:uncharacterized protein (TIGR03437 family)
MRYLTTFIFLALLGYGQITSIGSISPGTIQAWAANWDRSELYIADSEHGVILILDGQTLETKGSLPSVQQLAGMCLDPASGRLALTSSPSTSLESFVTFMDPKDGSMGSRINTTMTGAGSCAFTSDGTHLYVGNPLLGLPNLKKLAEVEVATGQVTQTWTTDESAVHRLLTLPNGKLYILTQDFSSSVNGTIAIGNLYQLTGGTIKAVDAGGLWTLTMLASPDSSRLYSYTTGGSPGGDELVFDTSSDKVIARMTRRGDMSAFPSSDPWFRYNGYTTGINGVNIPRQVYNPTLSLPQQPLNDIFAHRQDDGSDLIYLLRKNGVDLLRGIQPASIYSMTDGFSFVSGSSVAPGEIVSLFGAKLGNVDAQASATAPLQTALAGISVMANGLPCPLYYAGASQINLQVPLAIAGDPVIFQVSSPNGSLSIPLHLAPTAPGLWPYILHPDPTGWTVDGKAARGSTVILYASGLGAVSPPVPTGAAAPPDTLSYTVATPSVAIGGSAAQVLFSGLAPSFVGVYQLNVVIPANIPAGPATITLATADGASSFQVTIE